MKSHMRDSNNWYPKAEKKEESEGKRPLQPAEKRKQQPSAANAQFSPLGLGGIVAVFETDECGFISSWSAKAEQVYGYESIDMIGKHIASLYTTNDLRQGKPIHDLQNVESRGAYFVFGWQKRKGGNEFWAYSECQALRNAEGGFSGFRKYVVEAPNVEAQILEAPNMEAQNLETQNLEAPNII